MYMYTYRPRPPRVRQVCRRRQTALRDVSTYGRDVSYCLFFTFRPSASACQRRQTRKPRTLIPQQGENLEPPTEGNLCLRADEQTKPCAPNRRQTKP